MPGPVERQPLGNITTITPRQSSLPPYPSMGSTSSSEWVRILLDSTGTDGERMQRTYPRIRPARGGDKENDIYNHLDTFTIRCVGSKHTAIVHSDVVLGQSRWLRHKVANRNGPDAPVRIPAGIKWWQVAWALEYMYQGSVPGFGVLACEQTTDGFPERLSRSVAWGLLCLWDVADFFGLRGLMLRAEGAFKAYFNKTIRYSVLAHRGAVEGLQGWDSRLLYEFWLASWNIFGYPVLWSPRYIEEPYGLEYPSYSSGPAHQIAQRAIVEWESLMFDREGANEGGEFRPEGWELLGPARRSAVIFRPVMLDLCMQFARSGSLFELKWFQDFMTSDSALGVRLALAERMSEPESVWPRDEYPAAPYHFMRVDQWRLMLSNARAVPPLNAQNLQRPE